MKETELHEYDYTLSAERIAQYPVEERDSSSLLVFNRESSTKEIFRDIGNFLPAGSLLVFNNTRVIRARILFRKETGAIIEVFCLEPVNPNNYELSFSTTGSVEWKCIIGNLKKWKKGPLYTTFKSGTKDCRLEAEKISPSGDAYIIKFNWDNNDLSFGEIIEAIGHIPLPPYINREDESEDICRYQTVYSSVKGSVAAPTAGLHFTEDVLKKLRSQGIKTAEITLHVGAGTFKPLKSDKIADHEMHCEHFFVDQDTIKILIENSDSIIPVGTTSVRTLESLYWIGVKIINERISVKTELSLGQWEIYEKESTLPVKTALEALLNYLTVTNQKILHASTSIIITPGYKFRIINGLITNFHQPKSTLLLLVAAWIGDKWKDIYNFAIENDFRFLSYGDCSLLLR